MMGSLVVGFAIGEPLLSGAVALGGVYAREVVVGALYVMAGLVLARFATEKRFMRAIAT